MVQATLHLSERLTTKRMLLRYKALAGLFFMLALLGALIWSVVVTLRWMQDSSHLPLTKLVVIGERPFTTVEEIRRAILSQGELGTFMTQDVTIIQQQIAALPWIKEVSVRKQWPDKLQIEVTEFVPKAHWNDLHLLDAQGVAFTIPAERMRAQLLPLLYGPAGTEKIVLAAYQAMHKQLAAHQLVLKKVEMSARYAWNLILENGITLELGRDDHMERLARFIKLYPFFTKDNDKKVDYVDLRYPAGAAVGWLPSMFNQQNSEKSTNIH